MIDRDEQNPQYRRSALRASQLRENLRQYAFERSGMLPANFPAAEQTMSENAAEILNDDQLRLIAPSPS